MPRPLSKHTKVRLTLEITQGVRDELERLSFLLEADSATEVIRRAVRFYGAALDAHRKGKVFLRDADGAEIPLLPF